MANKAFQIYSYNIRCFSVSLMAATMYKRCLDTPFIVLSTLHRMLLHLRDQCSTAVPSESLDQLVMIELRIVSREMLSIRRQIVCALHTLGEWRRSQSIPEGMLISLSRRVFVGRLAASRRSPSRTNCTSNRRDRPPALSAASTAILSSRCCSIPANIRRRLALLRTRLNFALKPKIISCCCCCCYVSKFQRLRPVTFTYIK